MTPGLFRLFLATVVVVHHSFPLRLGAWAVGMFFILSGFWISRMWRRSYSSMPRPVTAFYVSRWWRLAPLFICVQAIAAIRWLGVSTAEWPTALLDPKWWLTQISVIGSTQFARLLPPAWSLDVEAQFYLLAPWFLMVVTRTSAVPRTQVSPMDHELGHDRAWSMLACVGLLMLTSLLEFARGKTLEAPYIHLYAWLFLVGVLCEQRDWQPSRTLTTLSGVAFVFLTLAMPLLPVTRAGIWISGSSGAGNRALSLAYYYLATIVAIPFAIDTVHRPTSKWDMWCGDLSYPLYLFHWFPRDWYYAHFDLSKGYARNLPLLMANFAMAYAGAIALLHTIDRPAQQFRKRWLKRAK